MLPPSKTKTPQGGQADGAFNTTNCKGIYTFLREAIKRRIWIAEYSLESSHQCHDSAERLVSKIMNCMGLVLLRMLEVRP